MAMTPRPRNDLVGLHNEFAKRLADLLNACANEGLPFKPFETLRTPQRQAYLYSKGRFGPFARKDKVTNARPWQSFHQYGLAADLVLRDPGWTWRNGPEWKRMHELAKKCWLRTLSFEKPHVQLAWGIGALVKGIYPPEGGEDWALWIHDQAEAYPKGAPKRLPDLVGWDVAGVERPYLGEMGA